MRSGEVGELLRAEGAVHVASEVLAQAAQGTGRLKELGKFARAQAGRPARGEDCEARAQAGALRGQACKGALGDRDSGETSRRCWRRCSVPRARRGAPSDDRGHGRGVDADLSPPGRRAWRWAPRQPRSIVADGRQSPGLGGPRPAPARALSEPEREAVLEVLHSQRFVDVAPEETYATLLGEGTYLCSTLTGHRHLRFGWRLDPDPDNAPPAPPAARPTTATPPAPRPSPAAALTGPRDSRSVHRAGIVPGLPSTSRQISAVSPSSVRHPSTSSSTSRRSPGPATSRTRSGKTSTT